jgi:hypothetical protein
MKRSFSGVAMVVVVAGVAGCSSSTTGTTGTTKGDMASQGGTGSGSAVGSTDEGPCTYPPNANTFSDASASGCHPAPAGELCQVSNGATVMPDGSVSGGTETCKSLCAPGNYELSCSSGPAGVLTPIPSPDPSLGCSDIDIPTPGNWLYYCCPCGS